MVPLCAIIYREGMSDVSLPGNLPDNRSGKLEQGSLALNEGAQPGQPSCRARWPWLSQKTDLWDNPSCRASGGVWSNALLKARLDG